MNKDSVTLTYSELLVLLRCGLDAVPAAVDCMREIYGDTAPMYDVKFTQSQSGYPRASFLKHNIH